MPKASLPFWIAELLLGDGPASCPQPSQPRPRSKFAYEWVVPALDANGGDDEALRRACCEHLSHGDPAVLLRALTCLFVVSHPEDAAAVAPLFDHPDGDVRRAAMACRSNIRFVAARIALLREHPNAELRDATWTSYFFYRWRAAHARA